MPKGVMLKQDIGLDQEGFMEVLVERRTPLPHEFSCQIQMNGHTELKVYEGNHANTHENQLLGTYSLENIKEGSFLFSLHICEYLMKIYIDDHLIDTVECTRIQNDIPVEETHLWHKAKKEFIDYVQSTILFLQDSMTQKHVPQWKWALDKLEWAKQIIDYPVSTEEYYGALHEIENMINPLLENTQHITERTPLL